MAEHNELGKIGEQLAIDYLLKNNNAIPNENIEVKDADLATYFSAHKWDARYQSNEAYKVVKFF